MTSNPSNSIERIVKQVKAARRVSTPLVAVVTPDPAATIKAVCEGINGKSPKVTWDIVRGFQSKNEEGLRAIAKVVGDGGRDPSIGNPPKAAELAMKLPEDVVLFVLMADRFMANPMFIQAVWLLRDAYKMDHRMAVLLSPGIDLPPELAGDVLVFDEPLPGADELREIIREVHSQASVEIDGDTLAASVEAVQGLPAFQAEQVVAMSLKKTGVDVDALWERKRQQIEQTPGLKVHRGREKFVDIGGVETVKDYLSKILHGQARPNAVVFIDEIEKMMAGSAGGGHDSTGVSADQLGSLLSYMQDQNAAGMIFVGPPGSAKSMVAKAAGNEGGVPTIQLDLGGMKGSLVGQSEQQLRSALKVVTSVSNGQTLWIATCNAISDLPPELRRRFTLGTFFFDLPDAEEREIIWMIHEESFGKKGKPADRPDDDGWTGAEIRQCCDIAWRLGVTLEEAAAFVVPVSVSASEQIERLRAAAAGRFLSANKGGVYQREDQQQHTKPAKRNRRAIAVPDDED